MADNAYTKLPLGGQLGVSARHRRPGRRPVLVLLLVGRHHRARRQDDQARSPQQGDPRPRGHGPEARRVPARGRAPGEEARDAQEHPAAGQGDPGPDAQGPGPGRAVEPHHQQLHSRGDGEQGVLPGVADRDGPGRQLPQPRALLRQGVAAAAAGQRQQPEDQLRSRNQTASQTISVGSTATTFVYIEAPPARAQAGGGRR